jgi:hypothetical protein
MPYWRQIKIKIKKFRICQRCNNHLCYYKKQMQVKDRSLVYCNSAMSTIWTCEYNNRENWLVANSVTHIFLWICHIDDSAMPVNENRKKRKLICCWQCDACISKSDIPYITAKQGRGKFDYNVMPGFLQVKIKIKKRDIWQIVTSVKPELVFINVLTQGLIFLRIDFKISFFPFLQMLFTEKVSVLAYFLEKIDLFEKNWFF